MENICCAKIEQKTVQTIILHYFLSYLYFRLDQELLSKAHIVQNQVFISEWLLDLINYISFLPGVSGNIGQ